MASDHEATCESDPNFAVICGFLEKFGVTCGLSNVDFLDLQYMLENSNEVPQQLIDLHVKLLRKARKSVSSERWERALVKVCHGYGSQDAWEIERFGYRKARLPAKLRILKQLLEMQFDYNAKFKSEINKLSAEELRTQPLGRDRLGHAYWFQTDDNCQIRVYKEDPDEETWDLVAKDREGLVNLITQLTDGKEEALVNEDSNSLESEKPVIDTGQNDSTSNSDEKDADNKTSPPLNVVNHIDEESRMISDGDPLPNLEKNSELVGGSASDLDLEKDNKLLEEIPNDDKSITANIKESTEITQSNCEALPDDVHEKVDDVTDTCHSDSSLQDDVSKTIKSEIDVVDGDIKDFCHTEGSFLQNDVSKTIKPDSDVIDDDNCGTLSTIVVTPAIMDTIESSNLEKEAADNSTKEEMADGSLDVTKNQVNTIDQLNPLKNTVMEVANLQTGLNLTVKPVSEVHSTLELSKRPETFGVKEKYMRSDISSVSSSVHHRKAVDSAGYSVHTKYLKSRMNDDEDELQEPTYIKRRRLDRPTLLGYRKKKVSSESSNGEDYEQSVSDEVEEPLMLVKGEGSGQENKDENLNQGCYKLNIINSCPIISDVIEEPIMFFQGEGCGYECETGNDDADKESSTPDDSRTTSHSLNNSVNSISSDSSSKKSNKLNQIVRTIKETLENDNGVRETEKTVTESHSDSNAVNDSRPQESNQQAHLHGDKTVKDGIELQTNSTASTNKTVLNNDACNDELESSTLHLVTDKNDTVPLKVDQNCKVSPDVQGNQNSISEHLVLKNSETDAMTNAADCFEKVPPDKNFSIYLEEKSRIKLNSCTDTVNNVKQLSTKNRPKKILNYKPKNVDTHCLNKTDNIKLDIKDNAITKTECAKLDIENEISKAECDDNTSNKTKILTDVNEKHDENLQSKRVNDTDALKHDCETVTDKVVIKNTETSNKQESTPVSNEIKVNSFDGKKHKPITHDKDSESTKSISLRTRSAQNQSSKVNKNISNKAKVKNKNPVSNSKQIDGCDTSVVILIETKRELRQRSTKENKQAVVNKKGKKQIAKVKNQIGNIAESNAKTNNKELPKETKVTDKEKTTQSLEDLHKHEDTDDDMEIDESVNKSITIIGIESQIVKPSDINMSEPIEMKCVVVSQETVNKITDSKQDIVVNEPKCVKGKPPLLTCIDIDKLKGGDEAKTDILDDIIDSNLEEISTIKEPPIIKEPEPVEKPIAISDSEKSSDVVIFGDSEPLTLSEESDKVSKKSTNTSITVSGFKIDLDVEDSIPATRVTRKRTAERSVKDDTSSKRPKMKGKRPPDHNLRRSIEEKKLHEVSSSDNDVVEKKSPRIVKRKSKQRSSKHSDVDTYSPEQSSDIVSDSSNAQSNNKRTKPAPRKKTLLGLDIPPVVENIIQGDSDSISGIRQSRRIAQLKIKEEAERRKLEELALQEHKEEQRKRKSKKSDDKDYKGEKKKHRKHVTSEEETTNDIDSEEKKKRKRKRKHGQFDAHKPWKSSSGSSSSEIEEEEEEGEPEEEDHHNIFKSDHEFSPESDLEGDTEWMPLKRARTVRKEIIESDEEEVDDCPCQKCGKSDHPEWILLCDSCDSGWHCSCLRPPLLVIPEGDWFCPPCQHTSLVKNLETRLTEYEKKLTKREMEVRRKERLAYVGISLDNVLPAKEHDEKRHKSRHINKQIPESHSESDSDSDSSESDSKSSSSSSSDSEPIYQLRERRQAHSYRFNDYDDLINSAIQDELDAVKGAGNQGRGKDISTIVNAEKEEPQNLEQNATTENGDQSTNLESEREALPPVVPIERKSPTPHDSDDEPIHPVKKFMGRKKHRKLNSLDISSEDDADSASSSLLNSLDISSEDDAESDEDFKGSSTSESEEEFAEDDEYGSTESSDGQKERSARRRKDYGPIRRSTRARISRYDRDFVNDNSDSGGGYSRKKKPRPEWEDTESEEESDRSWGRKKRASTRLKRKQSTSNKNKKLKKKKKKRRNDESDPEVYRRRPNIKFGGLSKDDEIESRRTRGKKINYLEALGSDSEEELRRKPPKIDDSEEEYIVQEDEAFKNHMNSERTSDASDVETALQGIPTVSHKKPRGKGKSGLKLARKLQEEVPLFPPVGPNLLIVPPVPLVADVTKLTVEPPVVQQVLQPLILDQEVLDPDDEPNPIELINKNVEAMNEQEMKKMMEEEDYANKQLQLLALQIEKERKRKEREAQRLERLAQLQSMSIQTQNIPVLNKNIPVPDSNQNIAAPNQTMSIQTQNIPVLNQNIPVPVSNQNVSSPNQTISVPHQNISVPNQNIPVPNQNLPIMQTQNPLPLPQIQISQNTPKKRGRKPKSQTPTSIKSAIGSLNSESLDSSGMALSMFGNPASTLDTNGTSMKRRGRGKGKKTLAAEAAAVASTGGKETLELDSKASSNSNPAPSSPMQGGKLAVAAPPQPFSQSQPAPSVITRMLQSQPAQKYFGGFPGPRGGPYQHPPPHYPVVRSGPAPPHRIPQGLPPPMYHPHRAMDPSPSGGGPINLPSTTTSASVPPTSSSPVSKTETTPPPPPPPYTNSPQLGHFPPGSMPSHLSHRISNIPSFHPGTQPSNFYGTYGPPPPSVNNETEPPPPPVYPASYEEQYAPDNTNTTPVPSAVPSESTNTKQFDEETGGGEFGGLVSYFSSQREDDLDT